MLSIQRIRRAARRNRIEIVALVASWALLFNASHADAATSCTAPLVCADGNVSAPTALTGTPTQYGVTVGGSGQATAFITPDASTTKYLKSGGSSANPAWSTIATGDLPSNVMLETENANLLGSGAASNGQVLQANGSGGTSWATPSTGAVPVILGESEGQISAGAGTVYMSLTGALSTTEATVRSVLPAATLANLRAFTDASPGGTSVVVTLGVGACTGAMTYGSVTVTPITAHTVVSDTSNTATTTAGQCAAYRIVKTGSTSAFRLRTVIERSA